LAAEVVDFGVDLFGKSCVVGGFGGIKEESYL